MYHDEFLNLVSVDEVGVQRYHKMFLLFIIRFKTQSQLKQQL